ncbi:aminoglycoside phosphotransferase family protein [Pseudoruegeria sp. HB172150]|uniref:aminoglycoside phosphotransferase family protein n=1 Tax=Pseudoruegeria sp. HB172150 TaxID=2721164 RepID=UPI0015569D14|nr:phosphotransferase [Pseudoruegeria sp. HB172150]
MADRMFLILDFLTREGWRDALRTPLAGDASARRYERLQGAKGPAILMDAPPDNGQDVSLFIRVATHLRRSGFSAPEIYAADEEAGLILLEDLGNEVFAKLVADDPSREADLYRAATDMLLSVRNVEILPELHVFTPARLSEMLDPFFDWYVDPQGCNVSVAARSDITGMLEKLFSEFLSDEVVFCLRDCHAENLMWLGDRAGLARVGLLDFQDAVAAHPAYDVVSMLQDARRDVSPNVSEAVLDRFIRESGADAERFRTAFALLGLQRNLRILGIFGRLSLQLGKPGYVRLIPRVWNHVQTNLAHPVLLQLADRLAGALSEPTDTSLQRLTPHVPA